MNTQLDTAIIDNPPAGFLPWSTKTKHLVRHAVSESGASFSDVYLYGAYAAISRGNVLPSKQDMMDAFLETPDGVVSQLEAYINRVTERELAATVEVEESPGKSN